MLTFHASQVRPGITEEAASDDIMLSMRPTRLIVPPSVAPHFEIAELRIALCSYLQSDAVPAEVFVWRACEKCGQEGTAGGAEIDFQSTLILPGYSVWLLVRNTSKEPRDFTAVLEGFAPRELGAPGAWSGRLDRERLAEARLLLEVERAIGELRSPAARWPDTAREVAARLNRFAAPLLPSAPGDKEEP